MDSRRIAAFTLFALLVVGVAGYVVYRRAASELIAVESENLLALAELRREALAEHLASVRSEVSYWAGDGGMRRALAEFRAAWSELGDDAGARLRRVYITENPHPLGEKDHLERAADDSRYSDVHAKHHFWLQRFLVHRGYYDVFLFDPEGDLIYTVFKEEDYGTNLVSGPLRDTPLGQAFRAARDQPRADYVAFFDFAEYDPSYLEAASFFAAPILDERGGLAGVLAFQLPVDPISEIMQERAGMGETGETYVVGRDRMMRSQSRFARESTILNILVDTETVGRALAGDRGVQVTPDYRGVPVLSAYVPLDFEGVRWAVMAEIDEAEVLEPARSLRAWLLAAGAGLLLALAAGVRLARGR